MDRLRIAVALPHLGVFGGVRRFIELGRVWIGRGHDVALLTPAEAPVASTWHPLPCRVGDLEEATQSGWDVFLSPDPELFRATAAPGALRVFYAVLEGAPHAGEALARADLVLANSAGMRRYLARRRIDAVAAPGGINPEVFHPPDPDPRDVPDAGGGAVRVLIYGRMSRARKGTWKAIAASERAARASRVPVALTLFDAPPDRAGERAVRRVAARHRWVLNPSQADLASLYRGADLFVSAERRAGWCNTAAEAMACGATVVCTRSGTEDFAEDGVTASVAPWSWTWDLARRIGPLLRDHAVRRRLAAAGLGRIRSFTWESTATRIEDAIRTHREGIPHG